MGYRSIRAIVRFIMKIITRIEVTGREYLTDGNLMIAPNHLGRLDTAVLFCVVDREDIIMPIAEKYRTHPLFGPLGRAVDGIWLNRFEADYHALREILARMKKGGLMVIAPEGTRSRSEALQPGKLGAAFLASKGGYPVVPVALTGTEDRLVKQNLKRLRRTRITVRAGKAFTIAAPSGKDREAALQAGTDEIMCRIAAMLPEKYRGVYADHPRLKELLRE